VGAGWVRHDPFAGPEDRRPGPAIADADQGASADLLPLAGGMGEGLGALPRLSMMIFGTVDDGGGEVCLAAGKMDI